MDTSLNITDDLKEVSLENGSAYSAGNPSNDETVVDFVGSNDPADALSWSSTYK